MAEKDNVLKENKIHVVGTIEEVDLKRDVSRNNNKNYIGGNIVIKSDIDGREQLTTLNLFAFERTKEGKENSFYKTYDGLEERIGERVSVDGELEENRFYSERNDSLISQVRNRAKFINKANDGDEDTASFTFGGYVVKPLSERLNKDEELIHYEIVLGQADYSGSKPIYLTFAVDPDHEKAVKFMQDNYEVGETVRVTGDIEIVHEQNEVVEENAFGEDNVRVFDNIFRTYKITGGSEPYEKNAYEEEYILDLAETYKKIGSELKQKSSNSDSKPKSKKATKTKMANLL